MGEERVSAGDAVADSGPLIHLDEIGRLDLLNIFDVVHVPDAVWAETVGQGRVRTADLVALANVRRHTVTGADVAVFVQAEGLRDLHAGETECLFFCRQGGVQRAAIEVIGQPGALAIWVPEPIVPARGQPLVRPAAVLRLLKDPVIAHPPPPDRRLVVDSHELEGCAAVGASE